MRKKKRNFRYGKNSKRKQSAAQLSNLSAGWNRVPKPPAPVKFVSRGTSMVGDGMYNQHNPSPATLADADKLQDRIIGAVDRIKDARNAKQTRTMQELIMLVQFVTRFVHKSQCSLTHAVTEAAETFRWDHRDIFRVMNAYLDGDDVLPALKTVQVRGRGSELFKQRYSDTFCVLKIVHMNEILRYVQLANKERGGMVTCGRIRAHLLQTFGILFKKYHVYYCLRKRLKLKFSISARPKIEFTAARKRATIVHCREMDEAIKLERAGTHIRVFMDESYCHLNHRPMRTWNEDGVAVQRSKSKGSLFIIVHALTMFGLLTPEGLRVPLDEWARGPHPTTEMIFRAKYATKNKVRDYHDTMDGDFFMYWVENRLVPAFETRFPGKKMILILDNAPYHHSLVADGFRPDGMSKEDIISRLPTLRRKRGVRKLKKIKVKPYADQTAPPPPLPCTRTPEQWGGFIFLDNSGEVWMVDGINDEGHGEAVIYYRVGRTKAGAVESTLLPEFLGRLNSTNHRERWYMLGHGQPSIRWLRSSGILNAQNKVPVSDRRHVSDIQELRRKVSHIYYAHSHAFTHAHLPHIHTHTSTST